MSCDLVASTDLGKGLDAANEVTGGAGVPSTKMAGVTVLLGLHNPPRSWTSTVGPFLPGFTIAHCVDSLL
jgi:hypothetical protein